jgi:archaellum component FlaC
MSDIDERDNAIGIAGALESKVQDIFDRNDRLEAECDSLRVAFEAVSQENIALRTALEQRTRQRDSARRTADLLDERMRKMQAIANEAVRAVHQPEPVEQLAGKPASALKVVQRGPA